MNTVVENALSWTQKKIESRLQKNSLKKEKILVKNRWYLFYIYYSSQLTSPDE